MAEKKEKKVVKEKKKTTRSKRTVSDRKVMTLDRALLEIQNLLKKPSKNIMENDFKLKGYKELANLLIKKEQNDLLKGTGNQDLKEIKLTVVDSNNQTAEERIKKLEEQIIKESKIDD